MVACFDTPTESFRKKIVSHYQATRKPTEDNLKVQFNIVKELVDAAHIRRFEAEGYEADDAIGTIVKQIQQYKVQSTKSTKESMGTIDKGLKTKDVGLRTADPVRIIILTGDKDMFQLVSDHVFVLTPQIGFSKAILYGPAEVEAKLGIPPNKVADFKALSGDASDNYEGIKKIGPKTAAKLISQYGSVENMTEHFDSGTMEMLKKMKEVSSIVQDVPGIDARLDELEFTGFTGEDFKQALQKYEMYSLLARFFPTTKKTTPTQKEDETKIKPAPTQDGLF